MAQQMIARVEVFVARLRMKSPLRISLGTITTADNLYVRVSAGNGVEGYGEGAPTSFITGDTIRTDLASAAYLAPLLLGREALDREGNLAALRSALPGNPVVLCAFDMALHDLAGRVAGVPVYSLLGGRNRELRSDFTVGIGTPEEMAAEATAILGRGYSTVKVKLGTNRRDDVERIRRIRQAIGDSAPLRIDANQGWDEPTARLTLRDLDRYGIEYCESPVPAWNKDAMARLRSQSPIPITADEALWDARDAMALVRAGACDFFNIKLNKSGGIREAVRINAIAEAAGIRCMIGCMLESRLGLTAAAHFASAFPNVAFVDLDSSTSLAEDPVVGGMRLEGETVRLPDEPGLGLSVDPGFLDGCEKQVFERP